MQRHNPDLFLGRRRCMDRRTTVPEQFLSQKSPVPPYMPESSLHATGHVDSPPPPRQRLPRSTHRHTTQSHPQQYTPLLNASFRRHQCHGRKSPPPGDTTLPPSGTKPAGAFISRGTPLRQPFLGLQRQPVSPNKTSWPLSDLELDCL
ncbi:hypothetical protein GWK47_018657 [Chionoecetes opilio]|uniref:Uncharacterized protein n=1 Tax=Chionoecetes opilio TaxID=41210 RepID=A0A8J4XUZ2_CHIOP|nr:hypothetical protein GWK47_018657 [Chionoecetes opilio]